MQDIAHQMGDQNEKTKIIMPGSPKKEIGTNPIKTENFDQQSWEEYQEKVKEYNNTITKLDEDYTKFEPFHDVIVRMYHREEKTSQAGLILDSGEIKVGQKAAGGSIDVVHSYVTSPWRYQTKCVVVAVPENLQETIKAGDVIQIKNECIIPVKDTQSDFILPLAFTLSDHYSITPPTKVSDKHFGYLRINYFKHALGRIKS